MLMSDAIKRAAKRFGHHNPSMFDVLNEVVSDEEYQRCRYARERWHKMLREALELVEMPRCPVCNVGFVPPHRKSCGPVCASKLRNQGREGIVKKVPLSADQKRQIVNLVDAGWTMNQVAEELGLTWYRVRSVVRNGRRRVLTEEERAEIIKQFNAGISLKSIAQALCMRRETVSEVVAGMTRPRRSRTKQQAFAQHHWTKP